MPEKENALTLDTFFNGRLKILQEETGYRFSVDAVLLAHHAGPKADDRILDLGTGCGIIPLILGFRHPHIRGFGVEIQKSLAGIARKNMQENGMEDRMRILCMDMRELDQIHTGGPVDLVVSNPPFRKARSGRINPDSRRAIARHEIAVTLPEVVAAGARMLRPKGRFVTVVPAERTADVLGLMDASGLAPKRLRMVHSSRDTEAKLVVAEGVKGVHEGVRVAPPLILYGQNGRYTEDAAALFTP